METRQARYRRRTLFKAGWFETVDAKRKARIREQIYRLEKAGPVPPEQRALYPFFLSHPLAQDLVEIEFVDGSWLGITDYFHAALALVAFRSASSARCCFQHLTNSGSGAVLLEEAICGEIRGTVESLKALDMWVTE
jgi:hypothetical protein